MSTCKITCLRQFETMDRDIQGTEVKVNAVIRHRYFFLHFKDKCSCYNYLLGQGGWGQEKKLTRKNEEMKNSAEGLT
jgi:hypothetical protein